MHFFTHHENVFAGVALVPGNVDDSPTINGATIVEPWKKGRNLAFHLIAGAMTTNDALTITIQVQKRSDDSWTPMLDRLGASLIFTVSKASDGGVLDGGHLLGTIDLERADGNTYKAIRLSAVNAVAQNVVLGAAYEISDVYSRPTSQTDDLLSKQVEAAG